MNDELTLDGVKYVSAKRAAEITQYSRDYIGQLCREGKVLASRIGRNWYVAEKSIIRHKTENDTETHLASHAGIGIGNNVKVPILDSLSEKEEGKPQNSLQSRTSVYNEPTRRSLDAGESTRRLSKPQEMAGEPARQSLGAGGPLATYYSDDRPLLPQLKREETKVLNKESQQKDGGNTVRINVVEAHVNVPTLYIDKKPAPVSSLSLVRLLIVIVFITVSLGFVAINTDYIQTTWSGARTLLGGSALAAFNQTAELVNVTIDDTIYNYLYASLFDD